MARDQRWPWEWTTVFHAFPGEWERAPWHLETGWLRFRSFPDLLEWNGAREILILIRMTDISSFLEERERGPQSPFHSSRCAS